PTNGKTGLFWRFLNPPWRQRTGKTARPGDAVAPGAGGTHKPAETDAPAKPAEARAPEKLLRPSAAPNGEIRIVPVLVFLGFALFLTFACSATLLYWLVPKVPNPAISGTQICILTGIVGFILIVYGAFAFNLLEIVLVTNKRVDGGSSGKNQGELAAQ